MLKLEKEAFQPVCAVVLSPSRNLSLTPPGGFSATESPTVAWTVDAVDFDYGRLSRTGIGQAPW
jgi:hypothetical protein